MEENVKLAQKSPKRLLLIARIWSVIIIAVGLLIFAGSVGSFFKIGATDPYAVENYPFIENIPPLFSFICIIGLAFAWKWKLIGGLIAIVFSAANYVVFFIHWPLSENIYYLLAPYGVNFLILVPGIMFVLYWRRTQKS